jgi:Flp pilus assembly pilin Flp
MLSLRTRRDDAGLVAVEYLAIVVLVTVVVTSVVLVLQSARSTVEAGATGLLSSIFSPASFGLSQPPSSGTGVPVPVRDGEFPDFPPGQLPAPEPRDILHLSSDPSSSWYSPVPDPVPGPGVDRLP